MRRAGPLLLIAGLAALLAAPATGRLHRLHLPVRPLSHSLSVDEKEWSITPSQRAVASGAVRLTDYNRGQDAHNIEIIGPNGSVVAQVYMLPGSSYEIDARLAPGTYHLICSLFAGTPQSHEARGMHALLTVR